MNCKFVQCKYYLGGYNWFWLKITLCREQMPTKRSKWKCSHINNVKACAVSCCIIRSMRLFFGSKYIHIMAKKFSPIELPTFILWAHRVFSLFLLFCFLSCVCVYILLILSFAYLLSHVKFERFTPNFVHITWIFSIYLSMRRVHKIQPIFLPDL